MKKEPQSFMVERSADLRMCSYLSTVKNILIVIEEKNNFPRVISPSKVCLKGQIRGKIWPEF